MHTTVTIFPTLPNAAFPIDSYDVMPVKSHMSRRRRMLINASTDTRINRILNVKDN